MSAGLSPVARGSAPLFWAQVVGNAGLFAALVPITRALGPTGRGTVAFITVTAMVAANVARFGITEATTVFAAQRLRLRPALLTNTVLSVTAAATVAAVVVCGALLLVPELRPPGVGDAELAVLALAMPAASLADAGYMFVLGCSRFRLHAFVTIVSSWMYAAVICAVWLTAGLTVVRAVAIWMIFQALKAAALLVECVRAEGLGRPDRALLRESASFGLRAWFGTLATTLTGRVDQILVALIASEAVLGIYAVAVNAFEILLYLSGAAATAMVPVVARADPSRRVGEVLRSFRSVTLLTAMAAIAAAVVGTPLLPLVFGPEFDASQIPFLWLLPGAIAFAALGIFSSGLVATSAPGRSSAGPVVALVLGVILDLVLIGPLGATGAAIAATASLFAGGATALVLYRARAAFAARAAVVPQRGDLVMLQALARPFARRR